MNIAVRTEQYGCSRGYDTCLAIITATFIFLFSPFSLVPQEGGFKYMNNYTAKEHYWNNQNWCILQDNRGCIYVGNQGLLIEYDGVSWRSIIIPNRTVRSMAMDPITGTIYIGGENELGFLAPDPEGKGTLQYNTLMPMADKKKQDFKNVLGTHSVNQAIYFRTYHYLFRWQSGQLKVIAETDETHRFLGSFKCGEKLFMRKDKVGLVELKDERIQLVPGGEAFASKKIFMMTPHTGKNLLIGTRKHGIYIYNHQDKAVPFKTGADDYLKKNQLYYGTRLKSGDYAMTTRKGGVIIMDARGIVKQIYRKAGGLLENSVRYVLEDSRENLWIAQDSGITKIEHVSPISTYDHRSGLPGIVTSVVIHGPARTLYAGTTGGLFFLVDTGHFQPVPGMTQKCNHLLSLGDSLLAATDRGVFLVGQKNHQQITTSHCYVLYRSKIQKNRVWAGTGQGIVSLVLFKDKISRWKPEHEFNTYDPKVRSIIEEPDGNLWLGTSSNGVIKVSFSGLDDLTNPTITRYPAPVELNPKTIHVARAAGHAMFATTKGIFRFDENSRLLIPDLTLGKQFADGSAGVFRIVEDKNKHIWFSSRNRNIEAVPRADGTYTLIKEKLLRIPRTQVNVIYPDAVADAVWFGGSEGLIRFDKPAKKDVNMEFYTLIRNVEVNGEAVFNGYKSIPANNLHSTSSIFKYKDRNLRFHFAAPFFEGETMTRYQTLLEGYDQQWSEETPEIRKDYTNLDSGSYIFRVRAINVYQNTGREARFNFKILPPWHRTWWAYFFYGIMLFLVMRLFVKWRSGKLVREKLRLEQIVKERSGQIKERNLQLESQTIQLKEQSEKLTEMDKVKTRFFANISHEFRTPLTLIMGPLEEMLVGEEDNKKLGLMLRNSRRLLNLINRLLELSKIESGKMVLDASLQNFTRFLKGIVASFEPVTAKKDMALLYLCQEEEIMLCFDAGKMEDVILNLLSNAFKFTPLGGQITVSLKRNPPGDAEFPSGFVTLSVQDTGPGIPRQQMEQIFDRFYQSQNTFEHHGKGSGIGLTIAKELVELHNGRIDVHSLEGKGTEFIICLPLPAQDSQTDDELNDVVSLNAGGIDSNGETVHQKIMMLENLELEPQEELPQEPVNTAGTNKNIILVVEDSADARAYIRGSLEPLYTVEEAKDGKQGIEKALKLIPDLIVSDIMMPDTDGYELCRELKENINTSHIPIILLTAKAGEEDILEGLQTGADDYITKPFNTKILNARIKNLIDLRSHLQQVLDKDMAIQPAKIPVSPIDKEFIMRLKEVFKKNVSDPEFNIEQLCARMEMSQPTLYRKIHALSGESPTEFMRSYRLKRGRRLLEDKYGSVIEVALEVGFSSAAYFTKCFKKKFNRLPSLYLEETKT